MTTTDRPTYNDLRAQWANIIEARVVAKAPNYNDWPDFPVINVETLDVAGNPKEALRYGEAIGGLTTLKQVRYEQLPAEIKAVLPPQSGPYYPIVSVNFTAAPSAGQSDPYETRNIRAIFGPSTVYYPEKKSYPAVFATLGCLHDYDDTGSRHQRGYHVGTCRKCGHRYMCDSGD